MRSAWGTAPIKCAKTGCGWAGTERDLIFHPEDAGKFSVRHVCPKCHGEHYIFPRRKRSGYASLVTERMTPTTSNRPAVTAKET